MKAILPQSGCAFGVCSLLVVTACSPSTPPSGTDAGPRNDGGANGESLMIDRHRPSSGGVPNGTGGSGGSGSGGLGKGGSASGGSGSGGLGKGGSGSGSSGGSPPVHDAGDPGASDVTFDVHANKASHPISSFIYGMNEAKELDRNRPTILRMGGNRWTAYNWETNASNAGSDYLFQNDGLISSDNSPAKPVVTAIADGTAHGAATLVTIPNVDYVSADKNGGGDVRNSGANYLSTRFKKNQPTKGTAISATPDPSDGFVYEDEYVSFLKSKVGTSKVLFSMDNEPDLWSSTHAEVHPNAVTYAELWKRNHDFSKAVKTAWPGAKVTGFVSYGFNGYVNLQNASDAGGRDFIEWYLDQAKAAEAADGRLIDYLDLHWYPEAQGGGTRIIGTDTGAAVVQAREQAPRSLWDSTYSETSWVKDYLNAPIDLVHRIQKKIDAHYPGTLLAFTEWNYGGGGHVSGAIAVSDVLGIFGRDGVALATYWPLNGDESYAYAAFRVFRNFDGNGGSFGDTSIEALTTSGDTTSVYASLDSANAKRTVIVAINKATTAKTAGIRITHSASYKTASVYTLTSAKADVAASASLTATAANAFRYSMPPQSVSVIVPLE